jgi:queuine tRNA-ribosyltransferase catalytic subunit
MQVSSGLNIAFFPAVTQHNLVFQARLMGRARDAIIDGTYPDYIKSFFAEYFGDRGYPEWCVNALRSVGVDLLEGKEGVKVVGGDGAVWDRAE